MYRKQRKSILHKKTLYFDKFRGINYGIPLCLLMLGSTGLLMLFSISGGEFNQTVTNHFLRLIVGFIFFIFFWAHGPGPRPGPWARAGPRAVRCLVLPSTRRGPGPGPIFSPNFGSLCFSKFGTSQLGSQVSFKKCHVFQGAVFC